MYTVYREGVGGLFAETIFPQDVSNFMEMIHTYEMQTDPSQ